jgi:hypothetical protein
MGGGARVPGYGWGRKILRPHRRMLLESMIPTN